MARHSKLIDNPEIDEVEELSTFNDDNRRLPLRRVDFDTVVTCGYQTRRAPDLDEIERSMR